MRLIDADALLKDKVSNAYISRFEIEEAPTINAEPVAHGHWIIKENEIEEYGCYVDGYVCSECFNMTDCNYKHCPHCGAKMDEGAEQE